MNLRLKLCLRRIMPRAVKAHRIFRGPLRGQWIVTSWHDYPAAILGYTELHLLRWFSRTVRPDETWLDIGAHYGYTAIALSRLVGAAGRVFAFEPVVSTAGSLATTRRLNGLTQLRVLPVALSDARTLSIETLPETRGMIDSTLCHGRKDGGRNTTVGEKYDVWRECVLAVSLDSLWQSICGERDRIDGVKIDVQGMEVSVLRGMTKTLKLHRPKLVVELHSNVDRSELLNLIESAGYSRSATPIEPVEGESEPQYFDDRSYLFQPI